jgi:LysM repeat protein
VSDRGFDPEWGDPDPVSRQPSSATSPVADDGHVCPHLRGWDAVGVARASMLTPDPSNRCVSAAAPEIIAVDDQRAVCLTARHVDCPRFLRVAPAAGAAAERTGMPVSPEPPVPLRIAPVGEATDGPTGPAGPAPAAPPSRRLRASAPIVVAVVVLAVAVAIAFASVVSRGDLGIGGPPGSPGPSGSTPAAGVVAGTRPPSVAPSGSAPTPVATPDTPAPSTAAPSPTPPPTAAPAATRAPNATPAPSPSPTPTPTPRRYAGLTACPGVADCYVYVVKRNDTLTRIAIRYGVGLDEILELNPSIRDPGFIYLGEEIRLPTPRR